MILLDTSFIVSYEVEGDSNHSSAVSIYNRKIRDEVLGKAVITDYVFDETVTTIFYRTKSLAKAVAVGDNLNRSVRTIRMVDPVYDDSWNLFKSQKGTRLSFTDCTMVSTMRLYGIKNIATFDQEFNSFKDLNVVD